MITRILYDKEKSAYDAVVKHPVQTWAWGEFEKAQGHQVVRLGIFDQDKLIDGYSITFHKLPRIKYTIGKCLRGPTINHDLVANLSKIGKEHHALFIKLEPNIPEYIYPNNTDKTPLLPDIDRSQVIVAQKSMFLPYSYILDLTKSEEELLSSMHPKTRYNIKVANRHNVEVREENSLQGFNIYLNLQQETTKRQGFYLHTQQYFNNLWHKLGQTGMLHILNAYYQNQPIASVIAMHVTNTMYYVYAASTNNYREVMAPTLSMWETILLGKKLGCRQIDMWGSLGPNAKEYDPQYGFHRFKQGFGGTLTQFVGSYDLVLYPNLYKLFNILDAWRWKLLRLKAKIQAS